MAEVKINLRTNYNGRGVESAERGIARLNKNLRSLGKGFSGIGANLANIKAGFDMVGGAVMTAATAIGNTLKHAFGFETAVTNFKVLLGSVDAAKAHVAELKDFANSTPLTFGDLQQASKLLLSFGAEAETIMPSLKMLGDIAMGDAQKFQGLALVFAQVKSQGRLMGQDLLQMINQGFNPLTIIAKETGKSVAELKELMSQGAISFDMVAESMRIATSEGGLFHGALAENAKTGNGLVSTMQDKWSEVLRQIGEQFSGVAKGGLARLITVLDGLARSNAIQSFAANAMLALDNLTSRATATGKALRFLGSAFKSIGEAGKDAWAFTDASFGAAGDFVGTLIGGGSFTDAADAAAEVYMDKLFGGGYFAKKTFASLEKKVPKLGRKIRDAHAADAKDAKAKRDAILQSLGLNAPTENKNASSKSSAQSPAERKSMSDLLAQNLADQKKRLKEEQKSLKALGNEYKRAKSAYQKDIDAANQLNEARAELARANVAGAENLLGGIDDKEDARFANLRALGAAQHAVSQDREARKLAKDEAKAKRKIDALMKRAKGDEWAARNGLTDLRRLSKRDRVALDAIKKQQAAEKARADEKARQAAILDNARRSRIALEQIEQAERDLAVRMDRTLNALAVGQNG